MTNGTLFMLGLMMAVMLFFGVVTMIEPIKEGITQARTDLGCGGGGLSTGVSMTCILVDAYLPLYIGVGLGIAMAAIGVSKAVSGE